MRNLIGLTIFTFSLAGCPASSSSVDPVSPVGQSSVDEPAVVPSVAETTPATPGVQTSTSGMSSTTTGTTTDTTTDTAGTTGTQPAQR